MLYNRVRLKQNAKAAMAQANPKTWLVTLVFLLLLGVIPGAVNGLVSNPMGEYIGRIVAAVMENGSFDALLTHDRGEQILRVAGIVGVTAVFSLGVSIVVTMFRVVMYYGYYGYSLEVYRREPYAGVGSLFKGFPRLGGAVGSAFLVGLFSLLWGLLIYGVDAVITVLVLVLTDGSRVGTWAGLIALFLAAALIHTLITYRYCLTPYFIMDNKDMPVTHAITASVQTMRGNIWKRFVLRLSFLGWELLLTLFILLLFLAGISVVMLVSSGSLLSILSMTERVGRIGPAAVESLAMALLGVAVPLLVVFIVATLAQLPFRLWLTAYENVTFAGFYHGLAGEKMKEPVPAAVAPLTGSVYFDNTQPAAPAAPFTPPAAEKAAAETPPVEVEKAPVAAVPTETAPAAPYTPFGGGDAAPGETASAVAEPAAPAEPETPVLPEIPDTPADPEN